MCNTEVKGCGPCVRPRHYVTGNSLKTPEELVPADNSRPPSGPPPSLPAQAAFVFTSFYSPLHVSCFRGSSPSAVFFLCPFGLPDVVATGYFGSYLGITRSQKQSKTKRNKIQWKNPILEKNFHTCVPGCIMGYPKVSDA